MRANQPRTILFSEAVRNDDQTGPYIRHLRSRRFSQNTINEYSVTFRHWLRVMGDGDLRAISPDDVEEFLARMSTSEDEELPGLAPRVLQRRSAKTIANYRAGLASLWSWAVKRRYADEHVVGETDAPRVFRKPISPLNQDEIARLMAATQESRGWHNKPHVTNRRPSAERDRFLLFVLYETHLRISEAINLRIADIEATSRRIQVTVRAGKGDKSRVVSGGRAMAAAWADYIETRGATRDTDWVFVNITRRYGSKMTRGVAGRLVSRLGRRAGIQRNVTPHLLRTTGACHLAPHISAWELRVRMGHSDIKTTLRYVQAAEFEHDGPPPSLGDQLGL